MDNLNWKSKEFLSPGYAKAVIEIFDIQNSKFIDNWGFLISPNGFSLQLSNDMQTNKTMAGYVITRVGPALASMTLNGVFIDSLHVPERLRFIDFYDKYIESSQNDFMEFVTKFKQKITVEGYCYEGIIQSVSINKSGNQQFLYPYTINFLVYKRNKVHNTESEMQISNKDMKTDMGIIFSGRSFSSTQSNDRESFSKSVADILLRK